MQAPDAGCARRVRNTHQEAGQRNEHTWALWTLSHPINRHDVCCGTDNSWKNQYFAFQNNACESMHTLVTLGAPRVHGSFAIFLIEDRPGIVQNALLAVCTRRSGALLALESIALVTVRVTLTLLQLVVRSCPRTETHIDRERAEE